MTDKKQKKRSWWKLVPGFAVSLFFLWRTLRGIHYATFREMHFVHPQWIGILFAAMAVGYTVRIYRWWIMLRATGEVRFGACSRILLTSFAANNVLPFRIGDFLRVFAYASDLGTSPSTILSTVILERLLDVFTLLLFLACSLMGAGEFLPPIHMFGHTFSVLHFVEPLVGLVFAAVMVMLFGAVPLEKLLRAALKKAPQGKLVSKVEESLLMAFGAVTKLTFFNKLLLLVTSLVAWTCEGFIFVAAARALSLVSGTRGPWLALSLSNLSYLIPSSPGAVGPFEYFCKISMTSQGAPSDQAGLFGLLVHVVVLFTITLAGGIAFLVHRSQRPHGSLLQDVEALPAEMPHQQF